jgi:hypothetical protein
MTADQVFQSANTLAMLMWVLMIFLPNWKGTQLLTKYRLIPIILSLMYTFYIFISIHSGGGMDFSNLESVMQLFTEKDAVLAGWLHYLAFDLLVGMWILDSNKNLQINHLLIVPCLLGSFMMGPVGFLLFIILRSVQKVKS